MGTSVLLVFLAPLLAIYALFGGIFSEIMPSPKAEIALPYDEAQGLVWEYVEQEDYHINLIEEKIEGDEQIFVFEADQSMSVFFADLFDIFGGNRTIGLVIDFVFEDQNGNRKTYYHDPRQESTYPSFVIYDESECLTTEYTVTAVDSENDTEWRTQQEQTYNILRQPTSGDETTFYIVFFPREIEKMENGKNQHISFSNTYWTDYEERYYLSFGLNDGQLEIVNEDYELREY